MKLFTLITVIMHFSQAGLFKKTIQESLIKAIKKEDTLKIHQLIRENHDLFFRNEQEFFKHHKILTKAVRSKSYAGIEALFLNGVNINNPDINGIYPIAIAVKRRSKKMVTHLHNLGASLDVNDNLNRPLLVNRYGFDSQFEDFIINLFPWDKYKNNIIPLYRRIQHFPRLVQEFTDRSLIKTPEEYLQIMDITPNFFKLESLIDYFKKLTLEPSVEQIKHLSRFSDNPASILIQFPQKKLSAAIELYDGLYNVDIDLFSFPNELLSLDQVTKIKYIIKDVAQYFKFIHLKGYLKNPKNYAALFEGFDLSKNELEYKNLFFSLIPAPIDIGKFAPSFTTSQNKIRREYLQRFPVKNAKEFLDLYSKTDHLTEFTKEDFNYFLRLYPTIQQIDQFKTIAKGSLLEEIESTKKRILDDYRVVEIENMKRTLRLNLPVISDNFYNFYLIAKHDIFLKSKTRNELCPICLENSQGEKALICQNPDCEIQGQPYNPCHSCLCDGLKVQVKEKSFPFHCDNCHHELPPPHPNLLKKLGQHDYQEYLLRSLHKYHEKIFLDGKNCPTPHCPGRKQAPGPKGTHTECLYCHHVYCFECQEDHRTQSCELYLETKKGELAFKNLARDPYSNVRPCPFCYTLTDKDEACDHVTCVQCGNKWDWITGKKKRGGYHYSNKRDGSQPRRYRVPGEIDPVTGETYRVYTDL